MFYLKISSKSKETLKLFLLFLSKFKNNNLIIKYFPKQKIKRFISILKSPHANKSAQEQFEFRVYTKKWYVTSEQSFKFLYFLKKIQNNIFPLIQLKIEGIFYNKNRQINFKLNKLNPNSINIQFFENIIKKKKFFEMEKYVNLFDCYGELSIKRK